MLDFDDDALAIPRSHRPRPRRRCLASGVGAMIRVLALIHVVLVTIGAMDSSWAMAKSLALSQPQIAKEETAVWSNPRTDA